MLQKGIFTISIDTEMAWGMFDHGGHIRFRNAYETYRSTIRRLLSLFRHYDISATWAVVGHLFLERCERKDGVSHPDVVRPTYPWFQGDWFSCDPATNLAKDPFWYGKDIIDSLREASPWQEIGSHSFSHIIFSDPGTSVAAAWSDLAKCVEYATACGIKLETFVFPRNAVGHLHLLPQLGFKVYRRHPDMEGLSTLRPSFIRRLKGLSKDMIPISPPLFDVEFDKHHHLGVIPCSMQFRYAYGAGRWIPPFVRYLKARKGISEAISAKKIFHLWFHPVNFAWKGKKLFFEFEKILSFASDMRKKGLLDILPLCKIPAANGLKI